MYPTVGRIVRYISYGTPGGEYESVERAAIITEVKSEEVVSLAVINPTGMFFNTYVPYTALGEPGCWTWPQLVDLPATPKEN